MSEQFTRLLNNWKNGDSNSMDQLGEVIYAELRRLAAISMRAERPDHTLQPTALVNEAFLRLHVAEVEFSDRRHFYALASRMMRRVLVDHARGARRDKRGGGALHVTLREGLVDAALDDSRLLELDDALSRLSRHDPRKAEIIELQYFAGLTAQEIAEAYGLSSRTVERDARFARAWLGRELDSGARA
ncbi:sigma-70 family RNA polymerase sigma factor [Haliea sp. E17]|uniref:sigma-70 family RNA polymerase sigma factor n=1 Tax=Haliea sp. E17 TaxID=3401576 RepID=UPI003AABA0BA